jgi:hypothetical protein
VSDFGDEAGGEMAQQRDAHPKAVRRGPFQLSSAKIVL